MDMVREEFFELYEGRGLTNGKSGMALAFQCAEAAVQMMMGHSDEVEKWLPQSYKLGRVPGTEFE